MDDTTVFTRLIEWIWVPIVLGMLHLYRSVFMLKETMNKTMANVDKAVAILETNVIHSNAQRSEDKTTSERERVEVLSKINNHHDIVMREIKDLRAIVQKLAERIK